MENKENIPVPDAEGASPDTEVPAYAPEHRRIKRGFSRVGWTLVVVLGIWQLLMFLIGIAAMWVETAFSIPAVHFYYRYLLLLNEATLAAAMLVGYYWIMRTVPREAPEKRPFSAGRFVQILFVCFAVSIAGNIVGNLFLSIWNAVSGNSVGNAVSEIVFETNPWLNLLSVGLLAPILEELFFRKWLIDRTYPYGEKLCILLSALLFALFHMNFSQFFYAFGTGVILAYLYCRSGKIWLCMLLHALFNCFSGVLGSEILKRLTELVDSLAGMASEQLASLTAADLSVLLGALFYYLLFFGMAVAGLVIFCIKVKKIRLQPAQTVLPENMRAMVFGNSGMIVALIFTVGMMLYSLFV